MDNASLIIGLVLALICALPILYIANNQAKNRTKIKGIFSSFSQGNYNFSERETHYKKIYALDKANKGFLFIDLNIEKDSAKFVDLSEVSSCKYEENSISNEDAQIALRFKYKSGKPDSEVILYDLKTDKLGKAYWQENEQIAQKWQNAIQDSI